MIEQIKIPTLNAVFLASDPLDITFKSTRGEGYYFKAYVNVDGQSFDELGCSTRDDGRCDLDLKGIFDALFTNEFSQDGITQLKLQQNLMIQVDITIYEFGLGTEFHVEQLNLPTFYVLNCTKSIQFNHTKNIQRLSEGNSSYRLSTKGKITFPVWINSTEAEVRILEEDTEIYSNTFAGLVRGVYCFEHDLSSHTFTGENLVVEISNGFDNDKVEIHLEKMFAHPVSELYYKNTFGIYEYVQLFGRKTISPKYSRRFVSVDDNYDQHIETSLENNIRIHTGFQVGTETITTELVNMSSKVYLLLDKYTEVKVTSTKSNALDSSLPHLDNYIGFTVNDNTPTNPSHNYD